MRGNNTQTDQLQLQSRNLQFFTTEMPLTEDLLFDPWLFFLPSACSLTKQQDDHYLRTIRRDEMNVKWPKWKALLRTWIPLEPVRPEHLIPAPWRHSLLPRVITGGDSRQVIVRQARTTLGRASLISFDTRMDVGEETRDLLEAYVLQSGGRERDGEIWEESEGVRDTINTRGLQCI